ncbi:MAG: DMT family transporter [Litoreibacter sp.]
MVHLSDNMRGAGYMLAAMTAFTINDACMKALSGEVPLFQAIFMRSMMVVLLLSVLAWHQGIFRISIPMSDRKLIALRSAVEVAAAYFFISALFNMPIANVTAILQALPLTVSLAAAVFLGEALGWRRLSAILVGFIGVMLIVRPGGEGFSIYSVYVLLAVGCVTVRDLAARRMSPETPTLSVALLAAVSVLAMSGVGSIAESWVWPSSRGTILLFTASLFVIGGYIFSVSAMRSGEIGFVTQFRYASLLVALVLGLVFFSEFPDALTLVGSVIVVATGLFTLYRERKAQTPP